MIITEQISSPVITSMTATPSRFKIKASAKAFKILSGFYSEPILAIPRELGANAWDSHVKAKNTDTMFEVHAPNSMESWFSVRDFGTGLSPDAIDNIYTTYFESTKTEDNDSDGCMGLGSKTPFNYAENFTVTSWYKGKKHVYNCFIDANGSPNIMHVVSEDSTEHTGLEVKFAVKTADIGMWVDNIRRAYEPFRNRPVIKGANIEFKPREYLYQGKNWGYRKSDGYHSVRGNVAYMGNYCYPVSDNAIRNALYKMKDVEQRWRNAMDNGGFDFFFDIGDLEVAPNKEQLQYEDTNSTTLNILEVIKEATKELNDLVIKDVEVPSTRWEAMALYVKYNSYNSPNQLIRNIIGDIVITHDGKKIASSHETVVATHNLAKLVTAATTAVDWQYQLYSLDNLTSKVKRRSNYEIQGARDVVFLYTSQPTIKLARVKHYLKTHYPNGVPFTYMISDSSKNHEVFLAHKKYYGWSDAQCINIELMPRPPVTPRNPTKAATDEIFYTTLDRFMDPKTASNAYVHWGKRAQQFTSTDSNFYVDFLYYDPVYNGTNIDAINTAIVREFVNANLNGKSTVIYGINKKNQKLLKVGKWINIVDELKKYIAKHEAKYQQRAWDESNRIELEKASPIYNRLTRNPDIILKIKSVDTKKTLEKFMKECASAKDHNSSIGNLSDFYKFFKIEAKCITPSKFDVNSFSENLNKKYLHIFSIGNDYDYNLAPIGDLMNFIDENS